MFFYVLFWKSSRDGANLPVSCRIKLGRFRLDLLTRSTFSTILRKHIYNYSFIIWYNEVITHTIKYVPNMYQKNLISLNNSYNYYRGWEGGRMELCFRYITIYIYILAKKRHIFIHAPENAAVFWHCCFCKLS